MSLADEREWRLRSPSGQLAEALGVPVGARCPSAMVEARVAEVRDHYRTTYGRELSESEVQGLRQAAELQYRPAPARQMPERAPEIAVLVNRSVPGAGWNGSSVDKPSEYARPPWEPGPTPMTTGWSTTDPAVRERVQRALAERDRANAERMTNLGPIVNHIGPPT